jgi:hypothetical protein
MNEKPLDLADYALQTAQILELAIAPEDLPGTLKIINTLAALAALVTEFELSEEIEAAPTFNP